MFKLKKERCRDERLIGKGNFGEVFPYQKTDKDTQWVVKRMGVKIIDVKNANGEVDFEQTYDEVIQNLLQCFPEIVIGFSCDHPCIVPVRGYFVEKAKNGYLVYMKLPRMKMDLEKAWKSRKREKGFYEEAQIVKYFYSLVLGVEYLHNRKIFHRDIKPNNVLIDDKGNAKLSDAGTAKYVGDEESYYSLSGIQGAINYKAPELIKHEKDPLKNPLMKNCLGKIDSWSLGLTILEVCAQNRRFIDPNRLDEEIRAALNNTRREIEEQTSYRETLLDLILGLLEIDPERRLKVSDVRMKLEEKFVEIITQEYKESLGLSKKGCDARSGEISDSYLKIFKEELNQNSQIIEDACKINLDEIEKKINNLEVKLQTGMRSVIEGLEARNTKKIEEICKDYEQRIESLKHEHTKVLEIEREKWSQKMESLENSLEELKKQNFEKQSGDASNFRIGYELEDYNKNLDSEISNLKIKWKYKFDIQRERDGDVQLILKSKEITCKDLEDWTKDFVRICEDTGFHRNLSELKIYLKDCGKIGDKDLKELSYQIGKSFKNLSSLYFDFYGCSEITDLGIKHLSWNIGNLLWNLNSLHFDFSSCKKITNAGLKDVSYNIGLYPNNIKSFYLSLKLCSQIAFSGVNMLNWNIRNRLRNLNSLYLDFSGCNQVSEDIKVTLRNEFNNVIGTVTIK